jgi:monoamine oxidase
MIAADTGNVAFAGEGFSLHGQTSSHGAYQSGRAVASRMVDSLKLA